MQHPCGVSGKPGWLRNLFKDKQVTHIDLMLFIRQMYTLLKAGVPIMRAPAGLQESTQNPVFSVMLQDLRENLDSGRELSSAMRRHPKVFSSFYVSMVQGGEMAGMLEVTFMRLYDYLEFERDMRERIKTAMRYPGFVLIAMAWSAAKASCAPLTTAGVFNPVVLQILHFNPVKFLTFQVGFSSTSPLF